MKWILLEIVLVIFAILCFQIRLSSVGTISKASEVTSSSAQNSIDVNESLDREAIHASNSNLESVDDLKPLNSFEVKVLETWMQEKGYLVNVLNAGASVNSSVEGYEAMADNELRRMAEGGDRTASFILGKRLLDWGGERGQPLKSEADMEEAEQLLTSSAILGYTASLEQLVILSRHQAMMSRGLWQDDRGISIDLLVRAYSYAYLLEMRGDLGDGVNMRVLRHMGELTPEQDVAARQGADSIYSEWSQKRANMGYPPFANGVPENIIELRDRVLALSAVK